VAGSNARQVERVWICTALVLVLLASLHGMIDVNIDCPNTSSLDVTQHTSTQAATRRRLSARHSGSITSARAASSRVFHARVLLM